MLSYRLKSLRISNNRTQKELAIDLGLTRGTYTHYELGKRQPDYETLSKIAEYYDVSIDYLLGRTDEKASFEPKMEKSIHEKISELIEELELNDSLIYKTNPIDNQTKEFLIKTLSNTLEMADLVHNKED